jgi:hypothetical protein
MGDLAFGGTFNLVGEGEDRTGHSERVRTGLLLQEALGAVPWVRPFYLALARWTGAQKGYYTMGKRALERRAERDTLNKDLFYYIVSPLEGCWQVC